MNKLLLLLVLNLSVAFGAIHPSVVEACKAFPTGDHFVNDYSSCRGYHFCSNGNYVASGLCAEGLFFNNGTCDHSYNVQCMTCNNALPDSQLQRTPITGSCTDYAMCLNRIPVRRSCPERHIFNGADCVVYTPPMDSAVPPPPPHCSSCPTISTQSTSVVILVEFFSKCDLYIKCTSATSAVGAGLVQKCPAGQFFDSEREQCVPAAESPCGSKDPIQNCRPNEVHDVPSAGGCGYYHICFNGQFIEDRQSCPGNLKFSVKTFKCAAFNGLEECWDFLI